ncbi:MAG: hypothetical protein M3R54_12360, partial [Chloroflexota bacterium]|nr:hypothetical protein [Chloroflexota bacterium]
TIHLHTNGSVPGSLRRLRSAGLDSMTVRLVSARAATYEALHGPDYRFPEVRASLRLAAELRLSLSVLVLVLPGMFDRPDELAELIALLSELPAGSTLLLRDLHADPLRALARLNTRGVEPLGIAVALARIKEQAGHVRVGSFVRPLARVGVPNVP